MSELTDQLRESFTGIKVSVSWWGVKKTIAKGDKTELAASVGMDESYLDARRSLINTKNKKYRACTSVRSQAKSYWKDNTIAYPETGIRLLPRAKLDEFSGKFISFAAKLDQAVAALSADYPLIASEARKACKYNRESDYPSTIEGLFSIGWEVANLEPPEYLRHSHQRLYEREQARVQVLLQQTIANAEQALSEEFQNLLGHLVERLGYDEQGNAKQFRASSIENLKAFFAKFRDLNVTGNDDLESLVTQSQALVSGIRVDALQNNRGVRDVVRDAMSSIEQRLDDMIVDRPRRAIRLED